MTAERKKGLYVYYRCTGFKGKCGNTYIREERLADLLGGVVRPVQISSEVAQRASLAAPRHQHRRRAAPERQPPAA